MRGPVRGPDVEARLYYCCYYYQELWCSWLTVSCGHLMEATCLQVNGWQRLEVMQFKTCLLFPARGRQLMQNHAVLHCFQLQLMLLIWHMHVAS